MIWNLSGQARKIILGCRLSNKEEQLKPIKQMETLLWEFATIFYVSMVWMTECSLSAFFLTDSINFLTMNDLNNCRFIKSNPNSSTRMNEYCTSSVLWDWPCCCPLTRDKGFYQCKIDTQFLEWKACWGYNKLTRRISLPLC